MKFRMILRRLVSVVSAAALLLTGCGVLAAGTVSDLEALGVLKGVEISNRTDAYVTRGEFAALTVNLMGYSTLAGDGASTPFTDLADCAYADAVGILYGLKIISGTSATMFSPNEYVTYNQAAKIFVAVLGYSSVYKSDNLADYAIYAGTLGLFDGVVRTEAYITIDNALRILANALDIDLMSVAYYGTLSTYEVVEGNTYRKALMNSFGQTIEKLNGIVTADVSTYLYEKLPALKANQLEINNQVYTFEGTAPIGYVGMAVDFYITFPSDGSDGVVTSIAPTTKNEVFSMDGEAITAADSSSFSYEISDRNYRKLSISSDTKYVYNNRWEMEYRPADLLNLENADVRVIDNDSDGIYDVVFIDEYVDCLVSSVYEGDGRVYFASTMQYKNEQYLILDVENPDVYVEIRNAAGEAVPFEEIKKDNILSVARSNDGTAVKAVLSDATVTGGVSALDDEAVTIGGTAYPYAEGMQIQVGESVTAYLNFRGTVVYYKVSAGDANYAYIYAASPKSGLSSGYDVKILFAGPVSPKSYVETDTESGYTYSTGALFCKNSGVGVLSTDSTIRYNGKSMKAEEAIAAALSQPVRYALNKDGLLAELDTLTPASTGTKKTYNSAEQTFGKGNGSSDGAVGYGIEQGTTYAVCLPTNTDASDDDLQVFVELKDGTSYDMQGYELDEDTQMVDLIVLQSAMHASMAGVVTDGSDVAMVKKQSQVLDEDGVETIQLTLLTAEGEKDFLVSNLITDRDQFLTLSTGDLIGYSIDGFDELNGFELIQEKDRYVDYMMNQQMNGERCCGIVQSIRRNYVSDGRNRWVHGIEVVYSSAGGVRSYELYVRDMVPIFIIEDDEVSIGTFDDLLVEDRVFVTANLNVARALVIKR